MAGLSDLWSVDAAALPRRPDNGELALHRDLWREAIGRENLDNDVKDTLRAVTEAPEAASLLDGVFAHSAFLSRALAADPAFAAKLFAEGPDIVRDATIDRIRALDPAGDGAAFAAALRVAKREIALTAGLADIAGAWPLEAVTGALSDLAAAALDAACAHLLLRAHRSGDIALPYPDDPCRESGLIVLGMGKLGARELNYSSDIDLIVLYETERVSVLADKSIQQVFVRLARALVKLMEERSRDGYVFRTDLRLRPDPGSTPPALSTLAAETYYESAGQNWERAAMIKARPVAGDIEAGSAFLDILRPFMWRRSLDFAAIRDIQSIKRQINAHRGGEAIAVAGHNIKLGRGGIREIEFYAQTQQLIWGGREPDLRVRGTCDALDALVAAGHVDAGAVAELKRAYRFHRRLEHRLQMADDRQTHDLPEDDRGLAQLAAFMGFDTPDAFTEALLVELHTVQRHYAALFEEEADLSGPGNLVFTGSEDDPDTLRTLAEMGYGEPARVSAAVRSWHTGRYRAMRTARSRELLTELIPTILAAFAESPSPDAAFRRFDEFMRGLPAGIQLFSLFTAHPGLFELVAEIMGSAPRLADWLSRYPVLLDGVLDRDFFDFLPDAETMREELGEASTQARDFQDFLDIQRRWANDKVFQIGAHVLRGRLSPSQASAPLTDVADTCLATLLPAVTDAFAEAHGRFPGGHFAVVAFGKLGSREMTVGSDLDLMFVYDVPDGAGESDGPKPLTPGLYYARLCQRFIGAITAPTGEGKLYEVDMRLRPAGNAGPIATSFEAFSRYQHEDAWTWEHQALTRARVVCAEGDLGDRIAATIREVLSLPRDPDRLLRDVAEMRARMRKEFATDAPWAVKHRAGGLVDVEFIAQYLQLLHAAADPSILAGDTASAIAAAGAAGYLDTQIARDLTDAVMLWRDLQGILRLTVEGDLPADGVNAGLRQAIARACGAVDFEALQETMQRTSERTAAHFAALIDAPATALADRDEPERNLEEEQQK